MRWRRRWREHRGQPLAGIVVVTDGRSNAGEDPLKIAKQAAAEAVPIFGLAAGTSQGPRNMPAGRVGSEPRGFHS